ncbi:MAG: hypothetical protein ABR899_01045 [Candidatus Krumholzibacteriaceae bacterium]
MDKVDRWARILVIIGLVAMVMGAIDPLEGSLVILPGTALVTLGARLGKSRHRALLRWALALVVVGVGMLWGLSACGGVGRPSGHSYWWAIVLLPYPVGWIMGLVGAVRTLREGTEKK